MDKAPLLAPGGTVVSFDHEGWQRDMRGWMASYKDEPLWAVIALVGAIPEEEARLIAEETLAGANARGGKGLRGPAPTLDAKTPALRQKQQ